MSRALRSLLTLSALALGIVPAATGAEGEPFRLITLEGGRGIEGGVLTASLFAAARADLVTRDFGPAGERRVHIHTLDGEGGDRAFRDPVTLDLPEEAILIDFGKVTAAEHDTLLLFTAREALAFDPATGTLTPLVSYDSIYRLPLADRLPRLDLARDLDGDGRDDLLIPDFAGYHLFLQTAPGEFRSGGLLRITATMALTYDDLPWYRPATPYLADLNLDGLADILFRQGGAFAVFYQEEGRRYRTVPEVRELPIEIDEEGMTGISVRLGAAEDQSNLQTRSLYQVSDLDRDGIADIVTLTIRSAGVFNKSSRYEIHLGRRGAGAEFSAQPDSVIASDGVLFGIDEQDFDGDGLVDFVVSSAGIGVGKILAALITGSFSSDLEFYRLQGGRYLRLPSAHREVTAQFDLSSGRVFYPTILITDCDGDGIADLVVQEGRTGFELFRGQRGDALFAGRPAHFRVPMPSNPDMISLADLNGDHKSDIVIRYQEDDGAMFGRLSVLIAQ